MILAFDTSGPSCSTALLDGSILRVARHEDMAKGQAERLMPLISETLAEAGVSLQDLTAIGVGIGPGNFTGIRISVSAARGLSLALGVPAIGVSMLEALALDAPHPVLATVTAPRDMLYLQRFGDGVDRGPAFAARFDLPDWIVPGITLVGQDLPDLSAAHGIPHAPAAYAPASAIARIAATLLHTPQPRPAPLYLKPADAAPSRLSAPSII